MGAAGDVEPGRVESPTGLAPRSKPPWTSHKLDCPWAVLERSNPFRVDRHRLSPFRLMHRLRLAPLHPLPHWERSNPFRVDRHRLPPLRLMHRLHLPPPHPLPRTLFPLLGLHVPIPNCMAAVLLSNVLWIPRLVKRAGSTPRLHRSFPLCRALKMMVVTVAVPRGTPTTTESNRLRATTSVNAPRVFGVFSLTALILVLYLLLRMQWVVEFFPVPSST